MIKILNTENTILNRFIAQMRDKEIQRDSMRFRRNMERVGEIMAYEISKRLNYKTEMVETPLGIAAVESISDKVVIATILRAGLPFHQGFLNFFGCDYDNQFTAPATFPVTISDGGDTLTIGACHAGEEFGYGIYRPAVFRYGTEPWAVSTSDIVLKRVK